MQIATDCNALSCVLLFPPTTTNYTSTNHTCHLPLCPPQLIANIVQANAVDGKDSVTESSTPPPHPPVHVPWVWTQAMASHSAIVFSVSLSQCVHVLCDLVCSLGMDCGVLWWMVVLYCSCAVNGCKEICTNLSRSFQAREKLAYQ